MTETTTETPSLTEVLVRHAIYSYFGVPRIAIDDFTLQDVAGDDTINVTSNDVSLIAQPGTPEWVDRMVRIRRSLVSVVSSLREDVERHERHSEGLGEALLNEANRRGWCDEYDTFAEEWGLPTREKEYEVMMRVTVMARDGDAALQIVKDSVVNMDISPEYNVDMA